MRLPFIKINGLANYFGVHDRRGHKLPPVTHGQATPQAHPRTRIS
jgi:hypothetical protein